ncbi:DnaA regulatory inactivator Hda [Pusillimonas sp. NJUB218]|uniref:DnaA regulatory inactivator Hda n=1 Tax=Pusillimonas sp. NJUB218 TaxID=2023230 RepID=UPI000F4C08DB|nr:DnaA regulatory inactivator Hda [Pusillimonas sp. NJUB218]ROT45945.1 DnaA regulatory inactivator Hda [Pusillimonas sp. NJUB218]
MTQQLILNLLPAPVPTLDNYVPGKNQAAIAALQGCEPGRAVYLWGPPGAGRSHLLQALGFADHALYIHHNNANRLLQSVVEADVIDYRRIAVDGVERYDDEAQAALFALYNRWRESASSTHAFALLVAGDRAPMHMPVREDLRTRLGWDLVFRLELLSDDERGQALQTRASERGLHLSPEVINWILTHYARDMNRLSHLIDALDHYSLAKQRAITLPLLREFLTHEDAAALATP